MLMHNPSHPGEILREMYLEPLGLTVTTTARALGVARPTLSNLVNEKKAVSPEMAYRLAKAFDTSVELWINLQAQHDVWAARRTDVENVERLVA